MPALTPERRPDSPCGCPACGWRGPESRACVRGFHAFCPKCGQLLRPLPAERKGYRTKGV